MIDADFLSDDDIKTLYWNIVESEDDDSLGDNQRVTYTLSKEIMSSTDLNAVFMSLLDH